MRDAQKLARDTIGVRSLYFGAFQRSAVLVLTHRSVVRIGANRFALSEKWGAGSLFHAVLGIILSGRAQGDGLALRRGAEWI
jgi:hypothetical protein